MRKALASLAVFAALAMAGHAHAAPPRLAACPRLPPLEAAEDATRKLSPNIPRQYAAIARANRERIAVSTLSGSPVCVDIREMLQVGEWALSSDGRFFTFSWGGYEAGGFILIDRTGRGQEVDTGDRPTFSPSRRRFAAIEISESGFGSLNGFAVWQVDPVGVQRLTFLENLPQMQDWRLDTWAGETCINLSAMAFGSYPDNAASLPRVARVRFRARAGASGWTIARGRCGRA